MWTNIGLCIAVALLVLCITHWIIKWRNPKGKKGVVLPPGSMGLPYIGETLSLFIPSYSLDLHPFIKTRVQRYGNIFRTSVAGRPVVVSTDPEFNNYVVLQEGRMVEIYYMDTFSKLFKQEADDESRINATGIVHKYIRGTTLGHFGSEKLKEKLLPQMEEFLDKTLSAWSSQPSVEVKYAASVMFLNFGTKQVLSCDADTLQFDLGEKFSRIINGLMSFPLNIPGTAYHTCLKDQEKVTNMLREVVKERRNSPERNRGDFLGQLVNDMDKEEFLSDEFIVNLLFAILFASFETISGVVALALQLLSDHPSALQELTVEHHEILRKRRENTSSSLTWDEYKSMTFTLQVINETLRLASSAPGLLRRVLKDIEVKDKGFTIPAGWTIMVANSALQLNPDNFKDPTEFNPWRWKDLEQHVVAKNFKPFGGGSRQCAGAEYSRVFMCTFFHVLLTKYRWTKIKGGPIYRNPVLRLGKGIHVKFSQQ